MECVNLPSSHRGLKVLDGVSCAAVVGALANIVLIIVVSQTPVSAGHRRQVLEHHAPFAAVAELRHVTIQKNRDGTA
ncbi:hypothetical protein D3C76_1331440 [compost metagenome]